MNNDDNIILYDTPHERAQLAILVTPKIGFQSIHNIDHIMTLTRLPCSKEMAEKWVDYMRECLKERFVWAEIKEEKI
jgi:hypothetical protein